MKWLLLLLLCSAGYPSPAQNLSTFHKVEGTISNIVYCVFQDSQGYIWIGTEAGVSRYDGYGFRHFTKDDGLSDNDIFRIHEDSKGRLWLLTYNGEPTVYDHGKILTPNNAAFLKGIRPGCMATGFVEQGNTIFYVTNKTVYTLVNDSLVGQLSNTNVGNKSSYSFFCGAAVWNGRAYAINPQGMIALQGQPSRLFNHSYEKKLDGISTKVMLHENKLLLTCRNRVSVFDIPASSIQEIDLGNTKVIELAHVSMGNIVQLLCTDGIHEIDLSTNKLAVRADIDLTDISSFMQDRENNLWAASLNKGLYCSRNVQIKGWGPSRPAYSMAVLGSRVFGGYTNSEIAVCNIGNDAALQHYPERLGSLSYKVYGMLPYANCLWIVAGGALVQINATGNIVQQIKTAVKTIDINTSGDMYFGSSFFVVKTGVQTLSGLTVGYSNIRSPKVVFNGRANSIKCMGRDSVYIGALDGMHLLANDQAVNGFFPDRLAYRTTVSKIIQTKWGIAFSTLGEGVVLMTKDSNYAINKNTGICSNSCNSVYASGDTLWIATAAGLSRVIVSGDAGGHHFQTKNYIEANGLPSNKVNDVVMHNDTVWAATEKGVCFFYSKEKTTALPAPSLVIEGIKINGEQYLAANNIALKHWQNNIQISFTGISFHSASAIFYAYKLDGAEAEWHYTAQRQVDYASLPAGQYHFLLKAANADGTWCAPISIPFNIAPPFWQTWWFIACISLIIIAIAYAFMRYRLQQQRQRFLLQAEKAEYARQLIELEQQALRLQMNPHFIFNAMTAVQGLYAAGRTMEAKEYLQRFSRLLRGVFEVSAFSLIPLSRELELIEDYIQLTISKLGYRIHYSINCSVPANRYAISPLLLQPFVENALVHGLLPMKKEGNLSISITQNGSQLVYTIQDDGRGITQQQLETNKQHGLSVTRKRIELLNQDNGGNAILKIERYIKEDGSIGGTRVTFTTSILYAENQGHHS